MSARTPDTAPRTEVADASHQERDQIIDHHPYPRADRRGALGKGGTLIHRT